MKNKYAYLLKNILLFGLNGFIPKALAFVLVPIYTSYLSTAEYGIADLLSTTVQLLIPIFTLDIQDAVLRFALDKEYKQEEVFSTAFRIVLCGTGIVCVGTTIASFFQIRGMEKSYFLFFVLMYFTTALNNSVSLFCRGIDKVKVIVVGGVFHSVVTLLANIVFLVVFRWGLTGYLAANSLGASVSLIYIFFAGKIYRYIQFTRSGQIEREMIGYSFPLIFSVIAWWINNASDRYILTCLAGISVSGIYAIAYKIPNLLSVFQNIFLQAWSISAIKEFDQNDADGFIGNMYSMMNFAMVIICSGIMVLDIPIARFLYSREFFEAWRYVPILLVSVVFNAMALFIGGIFTAVRDTKTLSYSTLIGAFVNTICNFIFIYVGGAYGAAISTLLGYAVTLILRHYILQRHIHMKISWKREIGGYTLLLIQMVVACYGIRLIALQMLVFIMIGCLYYREVCKLRTLVIGTWKKYIGRRM